MPKYNFTLTDEEVRELELGETVILVNQADPDVSIELTWP